MARSSEIHDPAMLLPALHQAQEKEGLLSHAEIGKLAASLKIPVAEVHSAATFYHYLILEGREPAPRSVCRGPVCSLPGMAPSDDESLPSISCPGLCDQPRGEHASGRFYSARGMGGGFRLPEPVDMEEPIFLHTRSAEPQRLATYRQSGGYGRLIHLIRENEAPKALEALRASGLIGRGGAGFPLASKWQAVREALATPKYVICNADEGEPGTFKDRPILHLNPHLLLEAMAIAGWIVGAGSGIIYLRYEYPEARKVLSDAVDEAREARLLGDNVAGSGFAFDVHVVRGAGSYVCGEETSLLNSLEGRRPWPRERPPFPTSRGLWGKPTVVNNVETLCSVPLILEKGPEWFRSLGREENIGQKIYSVSGKVRRPGNYELPLGITARELIFKYAGGPPPGHTVKAFTLGGISGGLLGSEQLDLALDYRAPQRHGAFLGSGGMIVLDDSCCVVDFARCCMAFYESESCGKCYPCRIGTVRLRELLDGLTGRASLPHEAGAHLEEIGATMSATSACGLGQSAPLVVACLFKFFRQELESHLKRSSCAAGVCRL